MLSVFSECIGLLHIEVISFGCMENWEEKINSILCCEKNTKQFS